MSTRASIHFKSGGYNAAIIYRHSDGHLFQLGKDLHAFLDETSKLKDNRWGDAEYLAAKYLVWQAVRYSRIQSRGNPNEAHYLDFLGVAPCLSDHGDIAYRYTVQCDKGGQRPKVFVEQVIEIEPYPITLAFATKQELVKEADERITLEGETICESNSWRIPNGHN